MSVSHRLKAPARPSENNLSLQADAGPELDGVPAQVAGHRQILGGSGPAGLAQRQSF